MSFAEDDAEAGIPVGDDGAGTAEDDAPAEQSSSIDLSKFVAFRPEA